MGDNSDFLSLLDEFKPKKPHICNISFCISAIDGVGMIISVDDESLMESEFFQGSLLEDNITEEKTIPKEPGFYIAKIKIHSFQCNMPDDPVEYDEVISLEEVQLIVRDKTTGRINFGEDGKIEKEPIIDKRQLIKRSPINQFGEIIWQTNKLNGLNE